MLIAFLPIERRAGTQRAGPPGGDAERELHRLLHRDPLHVGDLLRLAALPAAVHGEAARLFAARSGRRDAALPRHLRPRLLRRRPPLQPARGEGAGRLRRRLHHPRALPLLDGRQRLELRLAGPRDGRPRGRDRQLLPDRDHGRGHLGRRIPDQPRRRHHLHVSDRRRLDRPRPDDDGLLGSDPTLRRRHPGGLPARRGALAGRPAGRHRPCRRQAAVYG